MCRKIELSKYFELMEAYPDKFVNSGTLHIVTNKDIIEKYIQQTGKRIGVLYESPYRMMLVDLVYSQPGEYFTYERMLPSAKGAAVVCIPKYKDKYLLLKQYRHAVRDYQYGFPRGFGEDEISGIDNAAKELREELGVELISEKFLGRVVPDSGLCGNTTEIYLCEIASYKKKFGYEEIADVLELSWTELTKMICKNQITDGFTLSAYGLLSANKTCD